MSDPVSVKYRGATITISQQLFEEAKRIEDSERELMWIIQHRDQATPEQLERLQRCMDAIDRYEEDYGEW